MNTYTLACDNGYAQTARGMVFVEIDLDGVLCSKRCPHYRTSDGFTDYAAIRNYFGELGYNVGQIYAVK